MNTAKEVMDEHLKLLEDERAISGATAKVERLLAAQNLGDESTEVGKDLNPTGDANVDDLAGEMSLQRDSRTVESDEEKEARSILEKVKKSTALLESGEDIEQGTVMF